MEKILKKLKDEQTGITLVAFIITIAVMLILAGAIIRITIGTGSGIGGAKRAKFLHEVSEIDELVASRKVYLSSPNYTGSLNNLLGTKSDYNDKLTVQEGNLVYIAEAVSSKEAEWLAELGIQAAE